MSTTTRTPVRASALRTLSVLLAFTAVVGLVLGTAGFSAMEADRGLAVNVTDDTSAYLGYEPVVDESAAIEAERPTAVVTYRNRFGDDLTAFDVDVSTDRPDVTVASVDAPETLPGGTERPVRVTLECEREAPVDLRFDADGNGGGVSVSLDRTHKVTCVPGAPAEAIGRLTDGNLDTGGDEPLTSEMVSKTDRGG